MSNVNEMRDWYATDSKSVYVNTPPSLTEASGNQGHGVPDWFGKNYAPTLEDLEAKLEYDEIQLSIATDNLHRLRREIQGLRDG